MTHFFLTVVGSILSNLCKCVLVQPLLPTLTKTRSIGTRNVFLCRWYPFLGAGPRYWWVLQAQLPRLLPLNPGLYSCWLIAGAVQLNSSLLTLSVIAVLLPAAFHNAFQPTNNDGPSTSEKERHDILSISHGVCKFLLVYCPRKLIAVYPGCHYLAFQSVFPLCPCHTIITIHVFSLFMLSLVSTGLTQELIRRQ
jgi:hypothetical protein